MQYLAITLLAVLAAVAYGIIHDLFTAHACVEYFTIAHPRMIASEDPARLALFWGVAATWWVGLPLGIALALCARLGAAEPWGCRQLIRPLALFLAILLGIAGLAWVIGHAAASHGLVRLFPPWDQRIPAARHAVFIGDLWAHLASYIGGVLGGIVLCVQVARGRGKAVAGTSRRQVSGADRDRDGR